MSNYSWACRRNPLVKATMRYWGGKHVVYRFFGGGELLYVGMSSSPYERMKAHRQSTPWFPQVEKVVLKVYPSRQAALKAEAEAIRTERPAHNAAPRGQAAA